MKIPPSILRYWLAMNASAFQAAVHSTKAYVGVAVAHAAADSIPALNLQQLAGIFLLTFGMEILNYLDAHPLSELLAPKAPELNQSLLTSAATGAAPTEKK